MNPLVASVVRTYTPIIAGQIAAWLILIHIPVLPELTVLVTAIVGGALSMAYYTVVRILEQQWPAAGALLGLTASPDTYSKSTPATAAVPANPTQQPVAPTTSVVILPASEPTASTFTPVQEKLAALDVPAPAPEAPAAEAAAPAAPEAVNTPEPVPAEASTPAPGIVAFDPTLAG